MKLNGIFGTGSGKVGASVWAVNSGVQIVRPYQPNVSNPNTDAQVAQRAKLKLMSQIAAALAPIIAFKKEGLVSARNRFVSANFGLCSFSNGKATIALDELTLTGSMVGLPTILVSAGQGGAVTVNLESAAAADVDAVLYALCNRTDDDKLEIEDVKVANVPGEARTFATTVNGTGENLFVYAYGIMYANGAKSKVYGDYYVEVSNDFASLEIVRNAILSGATFTRTQFKAY